MDVHLLAVTEKLTVFEFFNADVTRPTSNLEPGDNAHPFGCESWRFLALTTCALLKFV